LVVQAIKRKRENPDGFHCNFPWNFLANFLAGFLVKPHPKNLPICGFPWMFVKEKREEIVAVP